MAIRHSWLATPMFFFLLLWAASSAAHMTMSEPPPINYKTNPNYNVAKADFDYSAPLSPSGSNYPCKGHLKDLDAPEGKPVRTYAPGGTYDMIITGSAVHGGGSCQASLSYDKGKTFVVITSYIGNCPHATPGGDQTFKFTVPKAAPTGNAVFAWTWFNEIGNREMYMNCASVTIGSGGARSRAMAKRALSGPEVFKANIGNGCTTAAGTDVVFPNPGPNIQYGGNAAARAPPSGSCQEQNLSTVGGSGTSGGSGSGSGSGTGTGTGAGASGTSTSGSSGGTGSDTSGAGAGTMGGGAGGSGNTGEASSTFISSSRGAAMGTATSRASSSATKKTSQTVAKSQSYTSFNTPAHTGGGGAGGDVVSTINPGTPTGDGAVETNAAGGNPGPSSVQDSQGCAYWRSQGYVCSGAPKSLLGRKELLQMFGGILLVSVISGL